MNIDNLVKNTLHELQELMQTKTVVGDPIPAADHTVIPVSKVSFGFASGGGRGEAEKKDMGSGSGEGIGGGWSIEPVAFVIIGKDGARLFTIGEKESVSAKLLDLAPKVVEAVKDFAEKKTKPQDDEKSQPKPGTE